MNTLNVMEQPDKEEKKLKHKCSQDYWALG